MIKKMIILIVMGLIFSSCQLFTEAIKDNIYRYETEETLKEYKKKMVVWYIKEIEKYLV